MRQFNRIEDIAKNRLCTGCGNCAFALQTKIKMIETKDENRRPVQVESLNEQEKQRVKDHCPSIANTMNKISLGQNHHEKVWGPVLEVWEAYSTNETVRFKGSSGGAITALSLYAIEKKDFAGTLHIKARKDNPILNEAAYSRNIDELMEGCGSRYAPASICDRLDLVETQNKPSVLIGKPCEIKAAHIAADINPLLKSRTGLMISIFCAGIPSHKGTAKLLKRLAPSSKPAKLTRLKYRGEGWPGRIEATWKTEEGHHHKQSVSYDEGWGEILQKYRQWRCHICEDHTGEYADISVGDPWQNPITQHEQGKSLIIIRTQKGKAILKEAILAGYIAAERKPINTLFDAQPNLYTTKGAVWGRAIAMFLLGMQSPRPSFNAFYCWVKLPTKAKLQSVFGTFKRIAQHGLLKPKKLNKLDRI